MHYFLFFITIFLQAITLLPAASELASSDPERLKRLCRTTNRPHSCELLPKQVLSGSESAQTDDAFITAQSLIGIVQAELDIYKHRTKQTASSSNSAVSIPLLNLSQTKQQEHMLNMCYRALGFLKLAKQRYPQTPSIQHYITVAKSKVAELDHTAYDEDIPQSARSSSGRKRLWQELSSDAIKRPSPKKNIENKNDTTSKNNYKKKVPALSLARIARTKGVQRKMRQLRKREQSQVTTEISCSDTPTLHLNRKDAATLNDKLSGLSQHGDVDYTPTFILNLYASIDKVETLLHRRTLTKQRSSPRILRRAISARKRTDIQPALCKHIATLLLPTFSQLQMQYVLSQDTDEQNRLGIYIAKAIKVYDALQAAGYRIIASQDTYDAVRACRTIIYTQQIVTPPAYDTDLKQKCDLFLRTVHDVIQQRKTIVNESSRAYNQWNHNSYIGLPFILQQTKFLFGQLQADDLIKLTTALAYIPQLWHHTEMQPLIKEAQNILRQDAINGHHNLMHNNQMEH